MIEWNLVHDLVCMNISKFFSELMTFKSKLLSLTSQERKAMSQLASKSLIRLRDLYFFDEGCSHALLNLVADKYLRTIVNMIYNVLACYLLIDVPPLTTTLMNKYKRGESKSPKKELCERINPHSPFANLPTSAD